jgi:hypothetical protein
MSMGASGIKKTPQTGGANDYVSAANQRLWGGHGISRIKPFCFICKIECNHVLLQSNEPGVHNVFNR